MAVYMQSVRDQLNKKSSPNVLLGMEPPKLNDSFAALIELQKKFQKANGQDEEAILAEAEARRIYKSNPSLETQVAYEKAKTDRQEADWRLCESFNKLDDGLKEFIDQYQELQGRRHAKLRELNECLNPPWRVKSWGRPMP
jgi:hypothetical protein